MEYRQRDFLFVFRDPFKYSTRKSVEDRMTHEDNYKNNLKKLDDLKGKIALYGTKKDVLVTTKPDFPDRLEVTFPGGNSIGRFTIEEGKGIVYRGIVLNEMLETIVMNDVIIEDYTFEIDTKKIRRRSRSRK